MVFSSTIFLLYFLPAFLLLHFIAAKKWKNAVILFASIFFYAWGAPKFVAVLIVSSLFDHIVAGRLVKSPSKSTRKNLMFLVVIVNVFTLLYFKYANFFVDNINSILISLGNEELGWEKVLLPIGISFFTFQKISFIVDCYRGEAKPMRSFSNYLLFVALFPQLIAGPIVRFKEIAGQIETSRFFSGSETIFQGAFRFIIGLSKKVLIANTLGASADLIFSIPPDNLTFFISWIGILAYAFQIYFDFSGYSDMAIGLGMIMGFKIPENFNYPYLSKSITEFWRRWHMSLSRWMKDYLYIPLGGNRVSTTRLYVNLWIVFIISGFWHGASWNFVIWGALHGSFLIIERLVKIDLTNQVSKIMKIVFTFVLVCFAWVFFRLEEFDHALKFTGAMLNVSGDERFISEIPLKFICTMVLAVFLSFIPISESLRKAVRLNSDTVKGLLSVVLLILCLAEIIGGEFNPFIYFRF